MTIFLSGDNDYAIRAELERLKADFLKDNPATAIEQYDGEELNVEQLPDLLRGGSLLSARRLVIVQGAGANKAVIEALAIQAPEVAEETQLIVFEPRADKRTGWYKKLSRIPGAKILSALSRGQLLSWLQAEAKQRGGSVDAKAADFLIERVGEDQWRLSSELGKLLATGSLITPAEIKSVVEPSPRQTVFDLVEDIFAGRVEAALRLYGRLRASETQPHQFIGLLSWQINAMLLVKSAGQRSVGEIAAASGLSPFVIGKSQRLVRRLTLKDLAKLVDLTIAADRSVKQSASDADRRVKLLIAQIARVIS